MGWWNNRKGSGPVGKLAPKGSDVEAKRILPIFKHHPCDSCGVSEVDGGHIVNAQYEIKTPSGSIFLCSHHYNQHSLRMLALGYEVKPHGAEA